VFFGHIFIDETVPHLIEIGLNCVLTEGVMILTHDWVYPILEHKYGALPAAFGASRKVTIGNYVYIGTNAIILKGVTIGNHVIIGAGSIVTHSIPDNCVAAGNPCKVLMSLDEYYEKHKKDEV
jgi:acetyltransferase-like isoleucine patch superfamily enzyme